MTEPRRAIAFLWMTSGTAVAALLSWHFRFGSANDTTNYFEIANKFWSGRFSEGVIQDWSPLFAWVLMPVMALPRVQHLPAAHAVQFLLVLLALAAAWRLIRMLDRTGPEPSAAECLLVMGVSLTAALTIVPASYLTPDVLALALVVWFVARAGEEAASADTGTVRRCVTGALWGAGYLARAYVTMFGGAVLVLASLMVRRHATLRQHARWLAPYAVGFLIVGGPWMATLSRSAGKLTMGQAGTNNVLAALDRVPIQPPPWPRELAGGRVRSFERPFPLTLPESYDVVPGGTFRYVHVLRTYARIVIGNLEALFFGFYRPDLPLYWPLGILGALVFAAFFAATPRANARSDTAWWLLLSGLLGLAMFVAVHVESRYLAPFPVILAAAIAGRSAGLTPEKRATGAVTLALVGMMFWAFPAFVWLDGMRSSRALNPEGQRADARWLAGHGSRYAAVGATYDLGMAAWLSETSVIASVDLAGATPDSCAAVARDLRDLKVDGVLTRGSAECGPWQPVPQGGWQFWDLRGQ